MPEKEQKKMRLTDDGELVDLDTLLEEASKPESKVQPIYCTNCGVGNLSDAKYCRSCGKALALQELKNPPRSRLSSPSPELETSGKRKNEEFYDSVPAMQMQGRPTVAWVAALRLWTMILMAGVIVCSFVFGVSWAIIPTLIAWFLVEAVRTEGSKKGMGFTSFWAELVTSGVMAGASIVAFIFDARNNTSWAVIPIMIAWFLVSAVRSEHLSLDK